MLQDVVPLVGTWIEIPEYMQIGIVAPVVPLVGTWIEIKCLRRDISQFAGRSPCGNVD